MGLNEVGDALAKARYVFVDTEVFSYHLGRNERYVPLTRAVISRIESGAVEAVTTTITLAELLTYPAYKGDWQAVQDYDLFLRNFPYLQIVPVDVRLAREAALVRAETRLKTPDAIQIAAARIYGCDLIITNDRPWEKRVTHPTVLMLADHLS